MKSFFKIYKYYFVLALIISLSFIAGIAAGTALQKDKEQVDEGLSTIDFYSEPESTVPDKINLGEFKLTAYCICSKCCGGYSDGYTATMTVATPGRTIAVDPDVIPYGSIVEINGEEYVAEDCGEAIKGNHIDVLCASHELAEAFGVQTAEVYLINNMAD